MNLRIFCLSMLLFTILDYQYLSSEKRNYAQNCISSRNSCLNNRRDCMIFEMSRAIYILMMTCYAYDVHSSISSKLVVIMQHIHQTLSVFWNKCKHMQDYIETSSKILLSIRSRLYSISRLNFEKYILLLQSVMSLHKANYMSVF